MIMNNYTLGYMTGYTSKEAKKRTSPTMDELDAMSPEEREKVYSEYGAYDEGPVKQPKRSGTWMHTPHGKMWVETPVAADIKKRQADVTKVNQFLKEKKRQHGYLLGGNQPYKDPSVEGVTIAGHTEKVPYKDAKGKTQYKDQYVDTPSAASPYPSAAKGNMRHVHDPQTLGRLKAYDKIRDARRGARDQYIVNRSMTPAAAYGASSLGGPGGMNSGLILRLLQMLLGGKFGG